MNLRDLLSELRENILHDRSDRVEGSSDFLWSDQSLIRYINEAQRRFARRGLILRDGTSEATRVTLKTGVIDYMLHPSVLAVMSARITGETSDLARTGHAALGTLTRPDTAFFDTNQIGMQQPGKPLAFTTDEQLGPDDNDSASVVSLRVFPAPSADFDGKIVQLRIVRLPLENMLGMAQVPEIPEDHHLEMLDWAAYLALRIVDHDAGNAPRANEFRASFEDHVKNARQSAMRKLFAPTPWGFGKSGWSWTS